ncbi:MAG: VanZ family protein, partial [Clostridia bacterium]
PALAALICACYAVIDELYQQFFSAGRGFEFADIAKDWVGIIAGTAIAVAVLAIRKALKSR